MELDKFSIISHEFKMPLMVLGGNIDVLERYYKLGKMDDIDFLRYINSMRRNCDKLFKMANNLIDVSYMQSEKTMLVYESVYFPKMLSDLVEAVRGNEGLEKLEIEIKQEGEIPAVSCDLGKIERVFLNLISNSVKYAGADAKITIEIKTSEDKLKIKFSNNGEPVPKGEEEEIFEPFVRLTEHLSRPIEGSGLGLAIVRKMLEAHGGSIKVDKDAQGCAFDIELPLDSNEILDLKQDIHHYNSLKKAVEVEMCDCQTT